MIKKIIKYCGWLLLFLVMLLITLFYYFLYSESGSKRLLDYGIKQAAVDLSYQHMTGNLAQGLTFTGLQYAEESATVTIDQLVYQSRWSWFDWHVELERLVIQNMDIQLHESTEQTGSGQPFNGFELPVSIDVKDLSISDVSIQSAAVEHQLEAVKLKASFINDEASVHHLMVAAEQASVTVNGQLNFGVKPAYQLNTEWHGKNADMAMTGQGTVTGDLQQLRLVQHIDLLEGPLLGEFELTGEVNGLLAEPQLDFALQAAQAMTVVDGENVQLNDLQTTFKGAVDAYELSVDTGVNSARLPNSQLVLSATGDSTQLTTQSAQILTPEGQVALQAHLDWQDGLVLDGGLTVQAFNPAQFMTEWPGTVNGQMAFVVKQNEQGLLVNIKDNNLEGDLKGQAFKLQGAATYAAGTFEAEQLLLSLGANNININGQVTEDQVDLNLVLEWLDLSLLEQELQGSAQTTDELSGDVLNPTFTAQWQARDLAYQGDHVAVLTGNSQGVWQQSAETTIAVGSGQVAGQDFTRIDLQQSGWLEQHEVELELRVDDFISKMLITGQYHAKDQATKYQWLGTLQEHVVSINGQQAVSLQEAVTIRVSDRLEVETACWRGQKAGQLCMELAALDQSGGFQGTVTVDAFDLAPWQVMLPEHLSVKGQLMADVAFSYQKNVLDVESNLSLDGGELVVSKGQDIAYKTQIEQFQLDVNSNQQLTSANFSSKMSDGSYIKGQAGIEFKANQGWQIDSQLNGELMATQFLAALTDELSEINGQIAFNGKITGPLAAPLIELQLDQPQGYLKLTRLGTVIEQLALSITTQGLTQRNYQISLTGTNVPEINQGRITSQGTLTLTKGNWQYQGDIGGDNFMLLNLPEIKFNISPTLSISATAQGMDIRGDVLIPYGHVLIQQLPPSTLTNSPDLVIHSAAAENASVYPVTLDIRAKIKEHIELDVIGLKADLAGGIQLKQLRDQNLQGFGELSLMDGSYEIYGQQLNIAEGELTFTGALDNPRLNVKANRKSISGEVVAGVELGGTVNNLQSRLYSEPALPEIEKLSYIMTGRGIDNSGNLDGESLKQAAIILGLNQSSPIFNQIQNQFGIDVLTVRESAATADTVVEAGKKINDKLYVSYNQGLFNRLGFWVLKYRINQFLNLQSTQGEDQSIELVYTRKSQTPKQEK